MPKRVLDFDALWASDKLAACADWAQAEYARVYELADASGSFELTNLRVIWGRVAAIRRNLTLARLERVFDEFIARGLLFTWEENGKRYGHWTGSDVPGRLPAPSWRARLERLAPPVPRAALAAYVAQYGARRAAAPELNADAGDAATAVLVSGDEQAHASMPGAQSGLPFASAAGEPEAAQAEHRAQLNLSLEAAQAQDSDWGLELDVEREREETPEVVSSISATKAKGTEQNTKRRPQRSVEQIPEWTPRQMLAIYETERGALPPAEQLTAERRRRCGERLAAGLTLEEFRAAVLTAAATPFLSGAGNRGWRASFDWLIANNTNVRKVLEGCYQAHESVAPPNGAARELSVGARFVVQSQGVRVKAATLERIRAREAARAAPPDGGRAAPGAPGNLPASPDAGQPPLRADRDAEQMRGTSPKEALREEKVS